MGSSVGVGVGVGVGLGEYVGVGVVSLKTSRTLRGLEGAGSPYPRTSTEEHDCGGRERSRPRAASRS